jgi:hypothetical protein
MFVIPTCYDIALANGHDYFSSRVQALCGQFDLSFFLIEPTWAAEFVRKLQARDLKVRVLIDMVSDAYQPDDIYFTLAREVKKTGGHVIDDPDTGAIMGHKAKFHQMLVAHAIPVPETVIVDRSELDTFCLTDAVFAQVGMPFVVKPAWGYGRQGVILEGRSEADLHRSAAAAPFSDSFLLQRKIVPTSLDGHVGWFRIFHVFGEVIPCWWHPMTGNYQLLTPLEERRFRLRPLTKIMRDIAQVSKIRFFSSEIALTEDGRFFVIDYLNTECDMQAKSFWPSGVPDELARHVAWVLVEHAMTIVKRRRRPFDEELKKRDADWLERHEQERLASGE